MVTMISLVSICYYTKLLLYIYHIFIHSSIDGHLGCFHILAIINNAVMNTEVHTSFELVFLFPLKYITRSEIAGSDGSPIF